MNSPRARGAASFALALPLLWIAGGCSGGDAAPARAESLSVVEPSAGAAPATAAAAAARPPRFAIDRDFPDPDVLAVDGGYLAFATNAGAVNVQVAWSRDLESWELRREDALPVLPGWASRGRTWAPEVSVVGGRYLMFFTAEHWPSGRQCVGVAVASNPEGPYDSASPKPLVCPLEDGGAIDASAFVDDDNAAYLLYKTDGNCCGRPTRIELSRLSADGTALVGGVRELIRQTQPWEGKLVEAPTLLKRDGRYVLFYSANDYAGSRYAIGYATAEAIGGPYAKADGPFLSTEGSGFAWLGPGGQDVAIAPDGSERLVFHSWDRAVRYRGINVATLSWENAVPRIVGPPRPGS
jgi:beta-xylosidase